MPSPDAVIRLEQVHKRFGRLEVLRGIDLTVPDRATTALIGPSGSGKSTLVRCINHLERIQSGAIRVGDATITAAGIERDGQRLSARGVAQYRAGIGMVFQSFNLFPHLTVLATSSRRRSAYWAGVARRRSTRRWRSFARSTWPTRRAPIRRRCRGASSSGWRSCAR
jgi:ABC-type sugar transport system ATPase subunit